MTYEQAVIATATWMHTNIPDGYGEIGVCPVSDYIDDAKSLLAVIGYEAMWGRIETLTYELSWFHALMTRFEPHTAATLRVGESTLGRTFGEISRISPPGSGLDGLLTDIGRDQ